jgi:hypothetical protein
VLVFVQRYEKKSGSPALAPWAHIPRDLKIAV